MRSRAAADAGARLAGALSHPPPRDGQPARHLRSNQKRHRLYFGKLHFLTLSQSIENTLENSTNDHLVEMLADFKKTNLTKPNFI